MSGYIITRRWATNTTSRNAFYQVFHIRPKHPKPGVAGWGVMHYGKLTPEVARSRRPVHGGNLKLQPGKTDHHMRMAFEDKTNGSYVEGPFLPGLAATDIADDSHLRRWLTVEFGAKHRDEILLSMGLTATAPVAFASRELPSGDDDDGSFIAPSREPETALVEPEPERDERWGSW